MLTLEMDDGSVSELINPHQLEALLNPRRFR